MIECGHIDTNVAYDVSLTNAITDEKFAIECTFGFNTSGNIILRRLSRDSPKWHLTNAEMYPDWNVSELPIIVLEIPKISEEPFYETF